MSHNKKMNNNRFIKKETLPMFIKTLKDNKFESVIGAFEYNWMNELTGGTKTWEETEIEGLTPTILQRNAVVALIVWISGGHIR